MEKRSIGSLEVSVVGLGTNNFGNILDEKASVALLDAALDNEVNFIDTADIYGEGQSEQIIGRWLGPHRDDVVLATKFGHAVGDQPGGATPEILRGALTRSLKRLQTDWIDLYIYHRPVKGTPIAETLEGLDEVCREGLVREVGCSNFTLVELQEALAVADAGGRRFVNLQNEFNILERSDESEILPFCAAQGIGYVPYLPLAKGLLTGKYVRSEEPPPDTRLAKLSDKQRAHLLNEENVSRVAELQKFFEGRGFPLGEVAISWLLTRPGVASVIAGASKPSQIAANAAGGNRQLTKDDLEEIDRISPLAKG